MSFNSDKGEFFGTFATIDNRRGIVRGIVTRADTSSNTSYGVGFFYDTDPPSKQLKTGKVRLTTQSTEQ